MPKKTTRLSFRSESWAALAVPDRTRRHRPFSACKYTKNSPMSHHLLRRKIPAFNYFKKCIFYPCQIPSSAPFSCHHDTPHVPVSNFQKTVTDISMSHVPGLIIIYVLMSISSRVNSHNFSGVKSNSAANLLA